MDAFRAHGSNMIAFIRRLAHALLGDYALYRIWQFDTRSSETPSGPLQVRALQASELTAPAVAPELKAAGWYFGEDSLAFGCFDGPQLVGLTFYWHGQRYQTRRSWPIDAQAAKLVHIVTASAHRGRGVASALIAQSSQAVLGRGFKKLYARIWHSNTPSLAAFARAGWRPCGWLVQINPLRLSQPWSLRASSRQRPSNQTRT